MAVSDKSSSSGSGLLNAPAGSRSNIVMAVGMVAILATLLIRMPTPLLDMLLACSISLAVAVLIITLFSKEALELSTFPSLLLFITLFRLSLNVSSTRLILLQGDAGKIIQTFGDFVAGGSFVVGLVIFLILFIISYGLGLILSLFSGQRTSAPDTMPRTIAPPPPPAVAAADPNPWWAVIRSLVFWTILFGVIGYSFFHYARDRWGLFEGVSLGRLSAWLTSLWRRIRRDARRTRQAIQERIRRRLAARSRAQTRRRFLSLRRLSPRERVRYFYVSVLHRSERQGFGRGAGQTPFEYEQVLLRELPDAADEIHELTQHFIEARYTEHAVDEELEQQAQTVWQRLKKILVSRRRRAERNRSARGDSETSPRA